MDNADSPMRTLVSVIICTRNRAQSLGKTLQAIGKTEVPDDMPAELIIVDNGSTDETADVINRACITNMNVRAVTEYRKGLSWARNSGMRESSGDVLLFTDDDVRPSAHWIEAMCRPIVSDKADIVSGKVIIPPHLQRSWMTQMHRNIYASVEEWGPKFGLVGANMAFGRQALEYVGAFDPELAAGAMGAGEEGLFIEQLLLAGLRGVFAGDLSTVEHHFSEERLLHRKIIDHALITGRSNAYRDYHWHHKNIRSPLLRMLKSFAGLLYLYALRPSELFRKEGIHLAEWHQWHSIAYFDRMRIERQRPYNYALRGMQKLNGILPDQK